MLTRTPNAPADLSRRAHAQRRLRRAANHRLFCSTNGCPTYMVPNEADHTATCPVCGLSRPYGGQRHQQATRRSN
jgi:hypothetical protein